ncbi:MAG TPA: hypothetical protein VGI93_19935 [Steroidobacteraceae bacterium]
MRFELRPGRARVFSVSDCCYFVGMASLQALLVKYGLSTEIAAMTPTKAGTAARRILVECTGRKAVSLDEDMAKDLASQLRRDGFDDLAIRLEWAISAPLD